MLKYVAMMFFAILPLHAMAFSAEQVLSAAANPNDQVNLDRTKFYVYGMMEIIWSRSILGKPIDQICIDKRIHLSVPEMHGLGLAAIRLEVDSQKDYAKNPASIIMLNGLKKLYPCPTK